MNSTFETERLILKPIDIDDGEFLFQVMNSPSWLEHIGDRHIDSITAAKDLINSFHLPHWQDNQCGSYLVINKATKTKMGFTSLFSRAGLPGVDIGFAYLEEFQGNGYGYEAATKVLELAKANGFNDIVAITDDTNTASQNLIKKLGLKYCKQIRLPDSNEDLMLFEL